MSILVLHAELGELLWTMACLGERGVVMVRFETNFTNLIQMTENPFD